MKYAFFRRLIIGIALVQPFSLFASPGMGASYGSAMQWFGFFMVYAILYALPIWLLTWLIAWIVLRVKKQPNAGKKAFTLSAKVYGAVLILCALGIGGFFIFGSLFR